MLISGTVGALIFMWSFHRAQRWPLLAFAREIVWPPAIISLAAGGLAWWASGSAGADPTDWTRARAIAALLVGGAVFVTASSILIMATKYVPLHELRGLMGLVSRMRSVSGPADGSI